MQGSPSGSKVIVVNILFDLVGWLFADLIGSSVARVLFPLLSFGGVTVEPSGFDDTFRNEFNHLGYRRDPLGRIEVSKAVAGPLGLLFALHRQPVARMSVSDMRDHSKTNPGYRFAYPGYACCNHRTRHDKISA